MDKKEDIIKSYLEEQAKNWVLSSSPVSKELIPYVRLNVKKVRLRKKFIKNPMFYRSRLPKAIVSEFICKRSAMAMSDAVWDTLNRESFARKVLLVKPLNIT
jgi:hypothetical protein